jgi:hypothetical protein
MVFSAVVRDDVILSELTLARVLDLLDGIQDEVEDVVVWFGNNVVAVRQGNGRVTRFGGDAGPGLRLVTDDTDAG